MQIEENMKSTSAGTISLAALCCVPLLVMIGVPVALFIFNKRLSQTSWLRKILAVVTGVIVDLGGTNVVSEIYVFYLAIKIAVVGARQHLTKAQLQAQTLNELDVTTISKSLPLLVFGILLSILGGYIAGKIARQNEILYGLTSGIGVVLVSTGVTLLLGLPTDINGHIWLFILNLAANLGCSTLGGYLAYLQRKHKQSTLPLPNIEAQ
jgi:hypothetical protein